MLIAILTLVNSWFHIIDVVSALAEYSNQTWSAVPNTHTLLLFSAV